MSKNQENSSTVQKVFIAIAMIAAGLALNLVLQQSIELICIMLGGVLAILALCELFGNKAKNFPLAIGYIVLAVWLFLRPSVILHPLLKILFNTIIVINGAEQLQTGILLLKNKERIGWMPLIVGIGIMAIGITFLFFIEVTLPRLGICMIADGVFSLIKIIFFDKKIKK